jgi:plastocyanin
MKVSKSFVPMCLFAVASLVALASCGGSGYSSPSSPSTPAPTPAAAADVTILISGISGGMSFSPATAAVKVGQTVSWKNNDAITHAIAQDGGGGLTTPGIAPGATSAPVQITAAGTLAYHCSIHPSMTGSLAVTQ